jgi:hypothetical protein
MFEPVSDIQLLAAIDRAERHSQAEGVQQGRITEHLGVARSVSTTRKLRPQVERLVAAGALVRSRRYGSNVWSLTPRGRERGSESSARRKGPGPTRVSPASQMALRPRRSNQAH